MRLNIVLSNRFKKDLKFAKKRGLDLELLNSVIKRLAPKENLSPLNIEITTSEVISEAFANAI